MLRLTTYDYLLLGAILLPIIAIFVSCAVSVWKDITGTNKEDEDADDD